MGSQRKCQVPSILLQTLRPPHSGKPKTAAEGRRLNSQGPGLGEGGERAPGCDPFTMISPGWRHGLRVLQIRHHHSRDGQPETGERCQSGWVGLGLPSPYTGVPPSLGPASHEATHHLLSVLRAPGIGEADEGAVDSDPSAPLQLGKGRWMGGLGQRKTRGIPRHRFQPTGFNGSSLDLASPGVPQSQPFIAHSRYIFWSYSLAYTSDPTMSPQT